jgi:hypothetical protein
MHGRGLWGAWGNLGGGATPEAPPPGQQPPTTATPLHTFAIRLQFCGPYVCISKHVQAFGQLGAGSVPRAAWQASLGLPTTGGWASRPRQALALPSHLHQLHQLDIFLQQETRRDSGVRTLASLEHASPQPQVCWPLGGWGFQSPRAPAARTDSAPQKLPKMAGGAGGVWKARSGSAVRAAASRACRHSQTGCGRPLAVQR